MSTKRMWRASELAVWQVLLIVAVDVLVRSSVAAEPSRSDDGPWVQQVVKAAADSVVTITVQGRDGRQASLGSGFVVAADGLIATNLHVIGQARPITVQFRDGSEYNVTEVHASDRQLDLAVIRIAVDNLTALPLVDADQAAIQGQRIIAMGNPMGLRQSVVSGIVSGEREIEGRDMLQIAMPIEQGNSGGPLLDAQGRVLGIVTLKSAMTANLGFAIQANALRALLATPNPIAIARWKTIGSLSQEDWSIVFGARWQQRSGQILVTDSGDSFGGRTLCLWQRQLPKPPFEIGVYVRLDNESGAAGLMFHADGHDRHYGFYPSAGRLRLTRFDGPTVYSWQILEEVTSPHYRPEEWNHLKVRVTPQEVICYVNDQEVLKHQIPESESGQVGLAKFRNTGARFRQFRVAPQIEPSQLSEQRLEPIRHRLQGIQLDDEWPDGLLDELTRDANASRQAIEDRADQLRQQAERLQRLASDIHVRSTCQDLASLFDPSRDASSLSKAALLVSRLDNHQLDVAAYERQLERIAAEISASLPDDADSTVRLAALNRYLFQENGFHGSRTNYYHAANSYIDRLLDDREGLPITLSILYIELAHRLDLTVEGVGLPGHFIVRFVPPDAASQYVDVFDAGKILSMDDVRRVARQAGNVPFDDAHLEAVDDRDIVLRMLHNLQGIAQQSHDSESLLRYLEAMVSLAPDEPSYRGMRAIVRHETGRKQAAVEDLDWFLDNSPEGIDLQAIRNLKTRFTGE